MALPAVELFGGLNAATSRASGPDRTGSPPRPTRAHIALAVPPGSRRARSQQGWLAAALKAISEAGWRCDRARNFAAVCAALAAYMDWESRTAQPTWELLCRRAHVSRATVARCLAWLTEAGLLGVVEHGSTDRYRCQLGERASSVSTRPGPVTAPPVRRPAPFIFTGAGNRAAVYVLSTRRTPPLTPVKVDDCGRSDTPSQSRMGLVNPRARSASRPGTLRAPQRAESLLQLSTALCSVSRLSPLARLSPRYLRHLIKDFHAASWTGADVLHALDYQPSGESWTYTTTVRHAAGWVRFRLACWRNDDGSPLPSSSQLSQLRRQAILASQAEIRRNRQQPAAPSGEYHAARKAAERRPFHLAVRRPAVRPPESEDNSAPAPQPHVPRAIRPACQRLQALPALPGDLRHLTPAGLARVLLIVRSDSDRRRITEAYFTARRSTVPPTVAALPPEEGGLG